MFEWIKACRKRAAEKQYNRGWDYACGALVKGTTLEELNQFVQEAHDFNDYSDFDRGVEAAIARWQCAVPPITERRARVRAVCEQLTHVHLHVITAKRGVDPKSMQWLRLDIINEKLQQAKIYADMLDES